MSAVMIWSSCFLIPIVRRCLLTEKPLIRVLLLLPGYPAIPSWIPPTLKGLESAVSLGADDPGNATAKQLDDRIWLLWNQDANFLLFRPNRRIGKTILRSNFTCYNQRFITFHGLKNFVQSVLF